MAASSSSSSGSSSSSSSSGKTPLPPTDTDLSQLPARMERFLDHSSRLSSLLSSFQACSWQQLLTFARQEDVRELSSALAWRLGWQVGQLRVAEEEGGSKLTGPARAAPGSGAAWHTQEAWWLLPFVADRLGDILWLRSQGAGGGGEGRTARHAAVQGAGTSEAGTSGAGTSGAGTSGAGTSGAGTSGAGTLGPGTLGPGTSRPGTSGAGTSGPGTSGPGTSGAGMSGVGIAARGEGSCSYGGGDPGTSGGSHTSTCSAQHLEDEETSAGSGCGAGSGGGGMGSDGGGASGDLDGAGPAASVEAAGVRSAVDYGRGAAELWAEVSELLPAAARAVLASAEVLLRVMAVAEGGARASGAEEGGGGERGAGAGEDGNGEGAAVAAMNPQERQLALTTWYCCMRVLDCASLLLLAHVGAEAAGAGGEPSSWRGVLLREVQLAGLLGAGVRLWGLVRPGEGWEAVSKQAKAVHVQLMEVAAVAFPAELRAVVEVEGGAAGEAAAGSGGPAAEGSSQPCPQPAPWCRVSLRAVRDALGGGGGGAELQAVGRVAGGWEPAPGERRALLEQGAGRLAAALWEEEEGSP